jgi:zinc protease
LPLDYYTKMPARIEAVTSADTQAAADKHVQPDHLLVIAVGDKSKIETGLTDLKLGPVVDWKEPEAAK